MTSDIMRLSTGLLKPSNCRGPPSMTARVIPRQDRDNQAHHESRRRLSRELPVRGPCAEGQAQHLRHEGKKERGYHDRDRVRSEHAVAQEDGRGEGAGDEAWRQMIELPEILEYFHSGLDGGVGQFVYGIAIEDRPHLARGDRSLPQVDLAGRQHAKAFARGVEVSTLTISAS